MCQLISERKCRFLRNFHKGNELCRPNCITSYASENYLSQDVIYISLFVLGGHVCIYMPACVHIRIVFKLFMFSLFLLQAAHVTNKVVYIFIINVRSPFWPA